MYEDMKICNIITSFSISYSISIVSGFQVTVFVFRKVCIVDLLFFLFRRFVPFVKIIEIHGIS